MFNYSIYGISFSSSFPFRSSLPSSSTPPILHVTEQYGTRPLLDPHSIIPIPEAHWNIVTPIAIYRYTEEDILHFPNGDQIVIHPQKITCLHAQSGPIATDIKDVRLLGITFAWWLLSQGHVPFHAGAVVVDGEAILFMAESRMGKSSLICSLVQKGIPLICDDLVAVHLSADQQLIASSAYPQMRLWPGSVSQFVGNPEDHPTVYDGGTKRRVRIGKTWGNFLAGAFPVSRIYFLERRKNTDGSVDLERLSGHEAFMELLITITMGGIFPTSELMGIWSVIEQFVEQIPVYKLSYPTGWQWLPSIHQTILHSDLSSIGNL